MNPEGYYSEVEAEEHSAEPAVQPSLEELLKQRAESAAKETEEKKAVESEAQYGEASGRIAELDAERDRLLGIVAELRDSYSEAALGARGRANEQEQLGKVFEKYRDVLAASGIETPLQMLGSDDLAGSKEAQRYREASGSLREQVGRLSAAKEAAQQEMPAHLVSGTGRKEYSRSNDRFENSNIEAVAKALEERAKQMEAEAQKAWEGTEYGKAAAALIGKVDKEDYRLHHIADQLNRCQTVSEMAKVLEDANYVWGEGNISQLKRVGHDATGRFINVLLERRMVSVVNCAIEHTIERNTSKYADQPWDKRRVDRERQRVEGFLAIAKEFTEKRSAASELASLRHRDDVSVALDRSKELENKQKRAKDILSTIDNDVEALESSRATILRMGEQRLQRIERMVKLVDESGLDSNEMKELIDLREEAAARLLGLREAGADFSFSQGDDRNSRSTFHDLVLQGMWRIGDCEKKIASLVKRSISYAKIGNRPSVFGVKRWDERQKVRDERSRQIDSDMQAIDNQEELTSKLFRVRDGLADKWDLRTRNFSGSFSTIDIADAVRVEKQAQLEESLSPDEQAAVDEVRAAEARAAEAKERFERGAKAASR